MRQLVIEGRLPVCETKSFAFDRVQTEGVEIWRMNCHCYNPSAKDGEPSLFDSDLNIPCWKYNSNQPLSGNQNQGQCGHGNGNINSEGRDLTKDLPNQSMDRKSPGAFDLKRNLSRKEDYGVQEIRNSLVGYYQFNRGFRF